MLLYDLQESTKHYEQLGHYKEKNDIEFSCQLVITSGGSLSESKKGKK